MSAAAGPGSVAVILTCYNEGAWIEEAVSSVLAQTAADAISEIVVADDGSDAATVAVLERLRGLDARITVLSHGGYGTSRNRNVAVRHCSAPLLAFLDADDLWMPGKLAAQLQALAEHPETGLVYTGFCLFQNHAPDALTPVRVLDHTDARDLALSYFVSDPPVIPSSVLLRRSVFELAGGFDESLRVFEDTEFFCRLARITRYRALVDPHHVHKRNHGSSITNKRQDLMMHHAFVAFYLARTEPRLLAHIPRRLSERARKLGNLEARDGRPDSASRFYRLALALRPVSALAWINLAMLKLRVTGLVYHLRTSVSSTKV
ncbi:glycosyltransferase family 2 protein [Methylobacterium sp. PvR107]|uniref:glycosyltransferase family 2 protein n=1 Tax=Methylobacterium sp. PvR107 TaxID=2806597 RepID=UPI001AE8A590|nr:glycosyltransferase family A protein [Methylobacterium sp. PvR107]MBP1180207.1 glycosyltransferase involved in cell wall biosynthesis [Methylobacterium sp. PvR107]